MSRRRKIVDVVLVDGVEGPSLYVNSYRVCGPKPWGGGKIVKAWKGVLVADFDHAFKGAS